jgi:hypothetical protein
MPSGEKVPAMTNESPRGPVCREPLAIRLARGRKSGKAFVMLLCTVDGRHFRGFVNHKQYVQQVIDSLEFTRRAAAAPTTTSDPVIVPAPASVSESAAAKSQG